MSFNKCIFTSGDSILDDIEIFYVEDTYNLTTSTVYFVTMMVNQHAFTVIDNVSNVEISGCTFYQNKGQMPPIMIGVELVHNLTISYCLFHNNDAQSALTMIGNVLI